jgi:hypothetical protein
VQKGFLPEDLKLWENLRKDRTLSLLKNKTSCDLKFKGSIVSYAQVDEFCGGTLSHLQKSSKKKRIIGILQGEFMIIQGRWIL